MALWILLALALVLAIWGIASRLIARSELRKRTVQDARLTVVTAKPQLSGAGDELVLPGIVQAFVEAAIYARTSGYLKNWYTDIGSHVKKGELMAEIETPEVDRQLSQARADLNTALANLALSRTTNERWKVLLATHSVSQQDADEKAGDAAAKDATAKAAEQNVARLQDLESFKRVLAPFDGVVTARDTDVGALINAGSGSAAQLFVVSDIRKLRVYVQVPQSYGPAIRPGSSAALEVPEYPGHDFHAQVVALANAVNASSGTTLVQLMVDNADGKLMPGSFVHVRFPLPSDTAALRIPADTLIFDNNGLRVATVGSDDKITFKTISIQHDYGKTVEIGSGLSANDRVISSPPDGINDGDTVKIASSEATTKPNKDSGVKVAKAS